VRYAKGIRMSGALQRITSEYVDSEDRLRLRGALGEGETVVLWLTRRLLDRMVPHLTDWLGQQPEPVIPPVAETGEVTPPVPAIAEAQTWLVDRIDLNFAPGTLTLSFFGPASTQCRLVLSALALRQWLEILLRQYRQGEWPEAVWAPFVKSFPQEAAPTVSLTLH